MDLKHLITIITIVLIASCKNKNKTEELTTILNDTNTTITKQSQEEEEEILLGTQTKDSLRNLPYSIWFDANYNNYSPSKEVIKTLRPLLSDIQITAFMGTWCADSQREIPAFYKILETAGYHHKNLTLITVSREKDTPSGLEKGLNIEYVPTLIFYNDQKELGRIVESPKETLEKDMLTILSGEPYKHTYAN